ncbi:MAG TPA: ferrous iron transport protein B, partial [Myxococcota bacterium]|nr:ferrous iron transport protein B [Myxococcota bacterium]
MSIALIGNPNCGKSTVFNALTGARQKVGNWPGVTVERKSGTYTVGTNKIEVIDLPGIYSLAPLASTLALDEQIALRYITDASHEVTPPILINIVDASALERHLYLTTQLLELGLPTIVVLNMMDVAEKNHLQIDLSALSETLQCPVVAMSARQRVGIDTLKAAILQLTSDNIKKPVKPLQLPYPSPIQESSAALLHSNTFKESGLHPIHALEGEPTLHMGTPLSQLINDMKTNITHTHEAPDVLIADTRYQWIRQLLGKVQTENKLLSAKKSSLTAKLDSLFLNRFLGIPLFFGIMYALFFFSINIGGAFQDFFGIASEAIFINGMAEILQAIHLPNWLIVILAHGIGKGINTTVTFIPVIGAMFLFLAFLEDSGYMARAAFIVDRAMRALGLPGKAFVPMIV